MLIPSAYAQAAGAAGAGTDATASMISTILPLLLVFIAFYFFMIRPQQRRVKDHNATLAAVKKGDEVVTAGGHIGKVTKVSDAEVEVEFAAGQRHRVVKTTLAEVRPLGAKPAND
ncbi:MAG: preprotein translocase subunit YajC [Sphingomonas sp.]|uniref:preprotein translocase subunit YajC n=1 Tax=Sphingomonas sp. TaxID=28214 RepID=UPI0012238023|nr:preprotein translocase subunit YajC [Sphingomonas sp.]THD34871.1 MAG: preprotein translocase subunit YajC [Sphingomonas sp.]